MRRHSNFVMRIASYVYLLGIYGPLSLFIFLVFLCFKNNLAGTFTFFQKISNYHN